MSAELQAIEQVVSNINRAVKPRRFPASRRGKQSDKGKETVKKKKVTEEKETTSEEAPNKKSPDKKDKYTQPMLPGMRGAVKREPKPRTRKPEKPATKRPQATQPTLPGMSKAGKPGYEPKPKRAKKEEAYQTEMDFPLYKEQPPVDLNPYNKPIGGGRQFGA